MAEDETIPEIRTVVVERRFPVSAARLWRALTQPHLMSEWLMQTDFDAVEGRAFTLRGEWGAVDCRVLEIEPEKRLSYTWDAMGLESTVTFTLAPAGDGTNLRMEQTGFRPDQERAYRGAIHGWSGMFDALGDLLVREATSTDGNGGKP